MGLVSSHLPFGSSEAFLYPEIAVMTGLGCRITIFPAAPLNRRRLHRDVDVDFVCFGLLSAKTLALAIRVFWQNRASVFRIFSMILKSKNAFRTKLKNLALFPTGLALSTEVRRLGITHLHAYWLSGPSTVALIAAQIANISWSFTAHSFDVFLEDNLIERKLESAYFGRAISNQAKAELATRQGGSGATLGVVHLGVTVPVNPPSAARVARVGSISLICPAYLLPVKGHHYLLEALKTVKDKGIDFTCTLAGEGPLRKALARKIHDLGLEKNVAMPGMVRHDLLLQQLYLREYDAVVLASVKIGSEFEGIPVSLMEAMAAGVPCIATRTGAIDELIDSGCGILVEERNASELQEAIIDLANNPERRKMLGSAARQRILQRFNADTTGRSLFQLMIAAQEVHIG